jgi:hypothetical protein
MKKIKINMKIGIMQPYFFPYIGYFQLINYVDEFVIYDNIKYTKKGWINRNRILVNGKDVYISLPLKKDKDSLNVDERFLSDIWIMERKKMLNRIKESYKKAPNFHQVFPIIEECVLFEEKNLFLFIYHSLLKIREYLEISTKFIVSSDVKIDHELRSKEKVLSICKARKADVYINPIGGVGLYDKEIFKRNGIDLFFIKTNEFNYSQLGNEFIPFLSIIDVMMFNSKEEIQKMLNLFSLS